MVELQHLPWTNHCILRVLQSGRCKEHMARVSVETIPRLSYLLQRALVRMGRETQRLSSTLGICTKHDITVSFCVITVKVIMTLTIVLGVISYCIMPTFG